MRLLLRAVLVIALVALVWWLWTVFFPSPEKVIRHRLAETAQAASFVPNEGELARVGNVAQLAGCFSPDVEVHFEVPGHGPQSFSGRDDIARGAMLARTQLGSLQVEFLDVNIALAPDKQSATATFTARGKSGGDANFFLQEMRFALKKINGEWLIIRIETVKTLS